MKLAIGILAHNEEGSIGATIGSLLKQSVIANPEIGKEIIVVANGCGDETAAVAQGALSELVGAANCSARVVDVTAAGKANAWNVFVHEASAKDADFFVLLDADIAFEAPDAIERLVDHLVREPEVLIAPDQPVKKFSGRGGVLSPLIRALQKTGSDDDHALSGQLYAARAAALRSVVMPVGVVVEDGFLRAMTLTKRFTEPENISLIRRAPGVRHFYKPYESLGAIYRYERRQAVGTTINRFLYDAFREWRRAGLDVTDEVRRRNAADPLWLEALIAERMKKSGPIAAPKNYVLRRLRRSDNWSIGNLAKTPLIAVALLYDLVVAADASMHLRRRAANGVRWDAIRTTTDSK